MWKKTKIMRISRQQSPSQMKINQKQLENVEYFKYWGSVVRNYATCTLEIRARIVLTKVAFSRKKTLFTSNLDLNLRK